MQETKSKLLQWYRETLIKEALTIAINSLEYDGEHRLAEEMRLMLKYYEGDNN